MRHRMFKSRLKMDMRSHRRNPIRSRSINRNIRSHRHRPNPGPNPRLKLISSHNIHSRRRCPSLNKTSSPNTLNRTRHNTPLRSNLMRSSRNTRRSHILISCQAARKRSRTRNQIKTSRQRLQRSAPKISGSY